MGINFVRDDFIIRGNMLLGFSESGILKVNNGCSEVVVPEDIEIISDYAFNNIGITKVTFPNGLRKIGSGSFRNNKIKEVVIDSNVLEIISAYAFYANPLEKLEINHPEKMIISGYAFAKCKIKKEIKDKLTKECIYVDATTFINK